MNKSAIIFLNGGFPDDRILKEYVKKSDVIIAVTEVEISSGKKIFCLIMLSAILIPLQEIIMNFIKRKKSGSKRYGSRRQLILRNA